jgi:hypothetical protein
VVVDEFTRCAHVQLSSPHPELTPPGCAGDASSAAPTPGDIRSTVAAAAASELSEAARQAAAQSFLGALTVVLWAIAGAAVLLACITLLLKRPVTAAA